MITIAHPEHSSGELKKVMFISGIRNYIFDLITTHTPISTVKQFRNLQITASVLFVYFFIKAYAVDTHLNCIDLSMQFK